MSTSVYRSPTTQLSKNKLVSMRRKLKQLGFSSLNGEGRGKQNKGGRSDVTPSGILVMNKSAGRSIARFIFTERIDFWEHEQTLSRPMDMRGGILLEAFPMKKQSMTRSIYEASLVPVIDEDKAVSHIDDFNVFLAAVSDDAEIDEAVDAQKIKRQLQAMGKRLEEGNSMVEDFLNYIKGFVSHCDELWAWQIQRLKSDNHAQAIMSRIADKV